MDLEAFFQHARTLPPSAASQAFRADLEKRWSSGERVAAEQYIDRLPVQDAATVVNLILTEFLQRDRLGQRPDVGEFTKRFPDYAEVIRNHVTVYDTLRTTPRTTDHHEIASTLPMPLQMEPGGGRYQIVRLLGSGGMGVVYLATDTQLRRQVALKVIRPSTVRTASARFHREAQIAASLNHPNLCPVFDLGRVGDIDYLIMPFIKGESLADRLRRSGPLSELEAARIVRTVALALQAAHDAGVVHRDIKPANIILNEQQEPLVTDFGLARQSEMAADAHLTETGAVVGTPAYMPPEQVGAAADQIGPASDVYSLGVVLYECLTGQVPFAGTVGELLRQVLSVEPTPPSHLRPEISAQLNAVCLRAMSKDPSQRFGSMRDFAAALSPPPRVLQTRRRWYLVSSAVLAVVLAMLAGGMWLAGNVAKTRNDKRFNSSGHSDFFQPGSRWVGEFRWGEDDVDLKPVELLVTQRQGEQFQGRYRSETVYLWEVHGVVGTGKLRCHLSKALNPLTEAVSATGHAVIVGEYSGATMHVTFTDPTDGSQTHFDLILQNPGGGQ